MRQVLEESFLNFSHVTERVSQDWSLVYLERLARCPGAEDRQGTADLAALSGWKRLRETLAGDRCALEHWQG